MNNNAIIKIKRYDPLLKRNPELQTYEVPAEAWQNKKVVDTLRYIYENLDQSLAFREPCRQRLCGACTVRINNKIVLACDAMSEKEMIIEPNPKYSVIKDLVVNINSDKE